MTANGHNEAADAEPALQFQNRAWSETVLEFSWVQDEDFRDAAHRNGWSCTQALGSEGGIGLDIYERRQGTPDLKERPLGAPLFLASYKTANAWQFIVLPRWQDLIDFLAHVSSTMLAAVLPSDASTIVYELCEKTDARSRERARIREQMTKVAKGTKAPEDVQ